MCFWIQMATLPYLSKKLGYNPITYGRLQTVFGVAQLLGGTVFGRFGDLFGSRNSLLIAFASSALSYLTLGYAESYNAVLMSRAMSVFMHGMQGAQMIVTDVSEAAERSDKLGKLGLSYGLGMLLGSSVGGNCVRYGSEHFAVLVAACGCLATIVLIYLFVPNNTKQTRVNRQADSEKEQNDSGGGGNRFLSYSLFKSLVLQNPTVRHLMLIKSVSGLPIGVLHSMFSILLIDHFSLSAEWNGYVIAYIGLINMLTQGFLVGFLTGGSSGEDRHLIKTSILMLSLSYAAMSMGPDNIYWFCLITLPMVVSGSLFSTLVQSTLTKKVSRQHTGSILGFSHAINALIRSISPFIGGYMFQYYGYVSFGACGFILNGLLFVYLYMAR